MSYLRLVHHTIQIHLQHVVRFQEVSQVQHRATFSQLENIPLEVTLEAEGVGC